MTAGLDGRPVDEPRVRPAAVLIGFMGAGKSTVGHVLAQQLSVDFLDTDHEIVARSGRRVEQIFAEDGEAAFRTLEAAVVIEVLAGHDGVVALGGGAVLTPAVRTALRGHRVVHLHVDADVGYSRVHGSPRPLLQTTAGDGKPGDRYRALLAERSEIYRDAAEFTVDAGISNPIDVATEISTRLDAAQPSHSRGTS